MSAAADLAHQRLLDRSRKSGWSAFDARVRATYTALLAVRDDEDGAPHALRQALIDVAAVSLELAEGLPEPERPLAA